MADINTDGSFLLPEKLAKLLPYKKIFSDEEKKERIALIPDAIDYWNNDIHYWDRKTKYGQMLANAYAFYRGTDPLYWFDLGQDERLTTFGNEHTVTWLSGDYHAYNVGSYGRDEALIYGLNDFDECVIADYQLDLWRLAVSINLIVRENGNNLDKKELNQVLDAMSDTYLARMRHFVSHKSDTQQQITASSAYGKLKDFLEIIQEKSTRDEMLDEWCPKRGESRKFDLTSEKLGSATVQEKEMIENAKPQYQSTLDTPIGFTFIEIARRLLAGTGSLGMDRFYVLVHDEDGLERILDVKEQPKPSPYPYMGDMAKKQYEGYSSNNALRVVTAHRKLSINPDKFMGWMELRGKPYSVQEHSPFKGSFPALVVEAKGKFEKCKLDNVKHYQQLAEQWASVLATHHAYAMRDEKEKQSLEQAIVSLVEGRDDEFKDLVRSVAFEYSDQVVSDWEASAALLGADQ
jgi:uncharacterized protein (DUF2252 family)